MTAGPTNPWSLPRSVPANSDSRHLLYKPATQRESWRHSIILQATTLTDLSSLPSL